MAKDLVSEIREKAEASLETFITLVHPQRVLSGVHRELLQWMTREEGSQHKMVLLPRDHAKSTMAAYWVVWMLTKNPTLRVLYISSTANLAEKQLGFIKSILTSPIYRRYWPDMVHPDEGKREKWTNSEIAVDHPLRKREAIRDPSVFTGGLTTSLTGLHCDIAVLDDVVVQENAYTEEGRDKTKTQYSLLASIEGADALELVVGTRYHPKDLYSDLLTTTVELYDEHGDLVDEEPLYETFERKVESIGDGTGEYLWPRQQRADGKWFGFDQKILATKRSKYLDKTQFRAQYYNDPNDISTATIKSEMFQYYDRNTIRRDSGRWFAQGQPLNIYAAMDFAYSLAEKADFTSIVVIGIDPKHNVYLLEIDRFKTNLMSEYFKHVLHLHTKWDFRKLRAEVTNAQKVIVEDLKNTYIKPQGLALVIEDFRPTRQMGAKEERIEALLQHRYANRLMWHYRGGNCEILEEELVLQNPAHDDVKDALASAVEIAVAPTGLVNLNSQSHVNFLQGVVHSRFGGIGL